MARWKVYVECFETVEVEADNIDEAANLALDKVLERNTAPEWQVSEAEEIAQ